MKTRKNDSESGFTLIEVIIAFVVVAIVAAMMTAYFGTSLTQSSIPIFRLNAAGKLNEVMEKITAEYDQIPRWSPATLYTTTSPASIVIPTPSKKIYYQYICTGTGTSGTAANEPGWPIPGTRLPEGCTTGCYVCLAPPDTLCTVTDNGVTWQLYAAAPTLTNFQTKIGVEVTGGQDYTRTFGLVSISYRVIQNRFIKFNTSNTEVNIDSTPSDLAYGRFLKVTIGLPLTAANRTDETLTTLFVIR